MIRRKREILRRGDATIAELTEALDTMGIELGDRFVLTPGSGGKGCLRCGKSVAALTSWVEVIGFEKFRSQGGTNHVALRQRTGDALCFGCMTILKAGGTEAMF